MSNQSAFVHLHVHTDYSLLDGAIPIESLISKAKREGMQAVAITDHGNMHGGVEFYQKALAAGIKPIIGCECYMAPHRIDERARETHHLVLLAQSTQGYQNLVRIASIAHLEGFYYKPRIGRS